ncbi:MAG: PorV/PorQ family protein [Calditrichaeota bacterium]|nr:PorV/PorQ family protein [Calditrichota bacterium]
MNKYMVVLLIILFVLPLYSQSPSGSAGGASNIFLRSGLSARVAGLGETFTAIADDENALYYNPAGLANIKMGAVGLNHTQWIEDTRIDNIVFGYNFDRKLGVAIGISHFWMPAIQSKNHFGIPAGDINVSSSIVNLGLGYKIDRSLYVGLGVKYFTEELASYRASGIAIDAGVYVYMFVPGLTLGLVVQNLGGNIQYDSVKEKIPFVYRAGLAYKIRNTGLKIAVDGVKSIDSDFALSTGLEYTLLKTFSLRFGNQFRADQKFTPGYGAGLNIDQKYLVDYTFYAFEDLGNTHRVGFTFRFNLPGIKIKTPGTRYTSHRIKKSRPPSNVYSEIKEDRIVIHWGKVYGAVYNVYAKTRPDAPWKKINPSLIRENLYEFKKPSNTSNTIFICVTSIMNSVESAFSEEVKIDVK